MPKLACFPLYFDDFDHDTAFLPDDDLKFKYLRLLWAAYQHDNSLPADDAVVAQLAGVGKTKGWRKKVALLRAFFVEENGFLHHRRVGRELEKLTETKVVRLVGGTKSKVARNLQFEFHSHSHNQNSEFGSAGEENSGSLHLRSATREEARERHPEFDIGELERLWRAWTIERGGWLRNADRAFLGFCAKHAERNPHGA